MQVRVDPANLHVTYNGFDRFVSLDVAVFCVDRRQLVGYVWRRTDLRLDDNRYAEFLKSGLGFTVIVPLQRSSKQVKAVVYDYVADRIGTAMPECDRDVRSRERIRIFTEEIKGGDPLTTARLRLSLNFHAPRNTALHF